MRDVCHVGSLTPAFLQPLSMDGLVHLRLRCAQRMWNMDLSWIMSFQSSLLSSSRKYALHASIDSREILLKSSSLSSKCRPNARFSEPVGMICQRR